MLLSHFIHRPITAGTSIKLSLAPVSEAPGEAALLVNETPKARNSDPSGRPSDAGIARSSHPPSFAGSPWQRLPQGGTDKTISDKPRTDDGLAVKWREVNRSTETNMNESTPKPPMLDDTYDYKLRSRIHPSSFDLGVTYEGAILEGWLRVSPAKEIHKTHIDNPEGREVLELVHRGKTGRGGLVFTFRAKTDQPIKFLAFVGFWTDLGKTCTHFSLEVKGGPPPGGRVLFCDSPFDASSDISHTNLSLVTRELRVQTNFTHQLPTDLSPFQTVLLHRWGLDFLVRDEKRIIDRYLNEGGRVIVLADSFFADTVMLANHLTEPHGIHLANRECGLLCDLQCDGQHIEDHSAMKGVKRLRWFRPSPISVKGQARILVHNPENAEEGFVACGGPHNNLFVIGSSLLSKLVCQGWPFGNGQLFANLLMN
jgi:hypothetical protein